jgi:hypothetical protein
MCCFSQPVESVFNTNIYARASMGNRQYLVYSMQFQASQDLAMILPLPVPKRVAEVAVQFINMENYPNFFADLRRGFPTTRAAQGGAGGIGGGAAPQPRLDVVDVGSFKASFVPTIDDFSRLDVQFRLPEGTWESLPLYRDYAFAVFKLKRGAQRVHPMAFEFPRRNPRQLFFPTVHIHDGKVHDLAHFDHALYCQPNDEQMRELLHWEESPRHAGAFMSIPVQQSLVSLSHHCYRRQIVGKQKNIDITV